MKEIGILSIFVLLIFSFVLIGGNVETSQATTVIDHEVVVDKNYVSIEHEDVNAVLAGEFFLDGPLKLVGRVLDDLSLGELDVSRVVLTPSVDPRRGVQLSFSSEEALEDVRILIADSNGYEVDATIELQQEKYEAGDSGYSLINYKASIDGLEPDTEYQYVIKKDMKASNIYHFKTLGNHPVTIGFFGDIQGYKKSQYDRSEEVLQQALEKKELDLIYYAGDIVDRGETFEQWQYFDEAFSEELPNRMFLTTIGNHDVKGSAEVYTHTFNYFDNGIDGLEERTFYIDTPFGRIASIDTESYSLYDEQKAWLEEIFSEVEGFKIVLMHRSVYPMSYDEAHVRTFSEVFEKLGIDLVLSGHDHIYSRTTVGSGEKQPLNQGVTYIVGGSGSGSKFYKDKNQSHRYWRDVVYDDDNPVFVILEMSDDRLDIVAYAVIEDVVEEIDRFNLSNTEF